jgi:biopolymer transport protein ExbD
MITLLPWLIILTIIVTIIEGSLEVKLPTIWTDEKQRWEESERREE